MLTQQEVEDQEPIDRIPYLDPAIVAVFEEIFPPARVTKESTAAEDKFNGGVQHVMQFMVMVVKHQMEGS